MHKAAMDLKWLNDQKRTLRLTDAQIADAAGKERSVINKALKGNGALPVDRADELAVLFQVSRYEMLQRLGVLRAGDVQRLQAISPSAQDNTEPSSIALTAIDLSFAMGPGTNLDNYVEEEPVFFDRTLLGSLTRSPAECLRIATGSGDSMAPTINDSDFVVFDVSQTMLTVRDKIWVCAIHGGGAIKRLRPGKNNTVTVISDNPMVPPDTVDAEDVRILGRVVASIRRH